MGGVAALAKAAGHAVTGSDRNVYPPMSDQLAALDISIHEGYGSEQFDPTPDIVVVGNVLSRGNAAVEYLLNSGIPYMSGPEWLSRHVLQDRWVLAVAGTHGKTTTASILAWILEQAGLKPGFLIGGVPANFGLTARLGSDPFFVVEADEYDSAFFDKRAKFVHYRPRTLVLNNLEYDHADIFADLDAIIWQFHQLIRTVPSRGRIVANADDANLSRLLQQGCWTPVETFSGLAEMNDSDWRITTHDPAYGTFELTGRDTGTASVRWPLSGGFNAENALAAVAAARHAGVRIEQSTEALQAFSGVKRRLEVRATVSGVVVYDDFAHHPTAIRKTLDAVRARSGRGRVVAVLEPRSNTMKMGIHRDELPRALSSADLIWLYKPSDLAWNLDETSAILGDKAAVSESIDELVADLSGHLRRGDQVVVMSNGAFGGLHQRLIEALRAGTQG